MTFYAPLDFSWAVKQAMTRIRPTILALVETEIWPNLIRAAKLANAKTIIINGRLSERSCHRYKLGRGLLRTTLDQLDLVCTQSESYASRFRELGISGDRVLVTGSVKYDGLECDRANVRTLALRRAFGISAMDIIFVAGSTMDGEEQAVFSAFRRCKAVHPSLRLVLAPSSS